MAITYLYNDNFLPFVEQSEKTILADFWASWCGPCRMVAPIVEEISTEFEDVLTVVKVDVEDADEIAAKFEVFSIPTLVVFKEGKEVDRIVGYHNKDALKALIQKYI